MGIDIPVKTKIGRRTVIFHGFGIVINESAIVGDDCIIRHGVTIGNKLTSQGESGSPRIGNMVQLGAGAIILGDIAIGDGAIVGAGAVVTKSVGPGLVVVGNPSRVLER